MSDAEKHYRLGLELLGQDKAMAAANAFERAAKLAPKAAPIHHMLGIAFQKLGRIEEAEAAISRAIGYNNRQPDYYSNRAVVRCGLLRFDDAVRDAEMALRLGPGHVGAMCNLGLAHMGAKRYPEAAAAFTRAVKRSPELDFAAKNLSLAIAEISDPEAALVAAQAWVEVAPRSAEAHRTLGLAHHSLGNAKETAAAHLLATELAPDDLSPMAATLFLLAYTDNTTAAQQLAAAAAVRAKLARISSPYVHVPRAEDTDRSLRIGFVSGDLREHSVSHFLLGLLPHLKAGGLTLAAYQTLKKTDATTAQLKEHFAVWSDISELSDADAAERIRADKIDILFDLSGQTRGNRQELFALRPAPLAVAWLGSSITTGNPAIDYVLCNDDIMPTSEEPFFVERPLRMPGPYLCFTPPAVEPPAPVTGGPFTFGSFNLLNKLSDRTLALYSRILATVPDSELLLKTPTFRSAQARARTLERFAEHGIGPDRLVLMERTPTRAGHLELYGRVAVALDPWPYSGTTTTMEALTMGVPVITLNEGRFVSRVSASLLATAGLNDWIASSEEEYVAKAVRAASLPAETAAIRPAIREAVVNSPLCDPVAFSANFTQTMRDIWRRWCLG